MSHTATNLPNIVIIYADHLGWGNLGCFGSGTVKTPNIDKLREDGVKLSRWYSNAPVCSHDDRGA